MDKIKRVLKPVGFIVLMILASIGLGFMNVITPRREAFYDNEIKTELVEEDEDEEDREEKR
ncbi:MAG: hypothetical protein RLN86_05685 [Cyclobacteriaceae bacterium]